MGEESAAAELQDSVDSDSVNGSYSTEEEDEEEGEDDERVSFRLGGLHHHLLEIGVHHHLLKMEALRHERRVVVLTELSLGI